MASRGLFSRKYCSPFFQCRSIFASLEHPDKAKNRARRTTAQTRTETLFLLKFIADLLVKNFIIMLDI
jgi:hypothetical protein